MAKAKAKKQKKSKNKGVVDATKAMMQVLKLFPKGSIAYLKVCKGKKVLLDGLFTNDLK